MIYNPNFYLPQARLTEGLSETPNRWRGPGSHSTWSSQWWWCPTPPPIREEAPHPEGPSSWTWDRPRPRWSRLLRTFTQSLETGAPGPLASNRPLQQGHRHMDNQSKTSNFKISPSFLIAVKFAPLYQLNMGVLRYFFVPRTRSVLGFCASFWPHDLYLVKSPHFATNLPPIHQSEPTFIKGNLVYFHSSSTNHFGKARYMGFLPIGMNLI